MTDTDNSYPTGLFTWADLSLPDPESGTRFYTSLFGWQAEDQAGPDENYLYTIFRAGGKQVGGLGGQPEAMRAGGVPPMWNSYVTVDDVAAAVARVQANGGNVIDTMDVMAAGRMAIVADPTGGVLMLWEAGDHRGAEAFTGHGTMSWNELAIRDVGKAQSFYAEVLGWRYEDTPGPDEYQLIMLDNKVDGQPYMFDTFNGGMLAMDENWPDDMPAHWMVYFTVDNTDEMVARVAELGGVVAVPPFDTSNGRISVINDPQGGTFSVIAPSQAIPADES